MISTRLVTLQDDLQVLADEINQAVWDDANDIAVFDAESLAAYLARQDTVFVACHEVNGAQRTLLGIVSGRLEIKPYDMARWLYIDEVDVCADQRRKGAGKAMMQMLLEYARDQGCDEVWLGTEIDNRPANALYNSLAPDDVDRFVGFTWNTETDQR